MRKETSPGFAVHDEIPISIGIENGAVAINLIDDQGVQNSGLLSGHTVVQDWTVELFDACPEMPEPVGTESLTPELVV